MRKLLWCCTAVLVAAGSLTAAGYQVCRDPASPLSQAVRLVAEAALPLPVLRGLENVPLAQQTGAPAEEPGKSLIPDDPRPAPVSKPAVVPATPTSRVVGKVSDPAPEAPPAIVVPDEDPVDAPAVLPMASRAPLNDSKAPPATMPLVSDETDSRATMPEVSDEDDRGKEEKPSVFQSWLRFFKEPASSAAVEASEPIEPEGTAGCQEDHYRHSLGCPYMGCRDVCPYTGHCKPMTTPKQSRGGEEASEEEVPQPKHHRANKPKDTDEPVRQPNVDTMEYRPSDGPLDETGTGGPF